MSDVGDVLNQVDVPQEQSALQVETNVKRSIGIQDRTATVGRVVVLLDICGTHGGKR